jgi:ribosome biogenesis GTPase
MRQNERETAPDIDQLPVGQVLQIFSLYCVVRLESTEFLCTIRKTLNQTTDGGVIVGDFVRFRPSATIHESGQLEGVVESIEPRRTVLMRADSFKQQVRHPVVANADQMLIVASVANPVVRWGLVDRMMIAAQAGGLKPVICLNKIDLTPSATKPASHSADDENIAIPAPLDALAYYKDMGIHTLATSVESNAHIGELADCLKGQVTVLAGHSGAGKSSLIRAVQPSLDIRVGEVSEVTAKGRHTTTSARRYDLDIGGAVIDTPGVKVFGLWQVTAETLLEHFPDVADDTAPPWRRDSYERILNSLAG